MILAIIAFAYFPSKDITDEYKFILDNTSNNNELKAVVIFLEVINENHFITHWVDNIGLIIDDEK